MASFSLITSLKTSFPNTVTFRGTGDYTSTYEFQGACDSAYNHPLTITYTLAGNAEFPFPK